MGPVPDGLSGSAALAARRARLHPRVWLAAVLLGASLGLPGVLRAQVPPDTLRRDTVQVPIPPEQVEADTLPRDSLLEVRADSLRPPAALPEFPHPFPTGWAFARWEWTHDELLRYRGLSLLQLLERAPALAPVRLGGFGRPARLAWAGLGGGRLRVFLDGFEIDPLGTTGLDLQHVGLVALESVLVERSLSGIRLELRSLRLRDAVPYSIVEVGTGNYDTRLLRAAFLRGVGERSTIEAAYELTTTDGIGRIEPFQFGAGRVAWTYLLSPRTGLRLELRQSGVERASEEFPVDVDRRDLLLRARSQPLPRLVVDGVLARSWWMPRDAAPGEAAGTEADPIAFSPELAATQAMVRAGYVLPFGYGELTARLQAGEEAGLPGSGAVVSARGLGRPAPWLLLEGEVRSARLRGAGATELSATASAGSFHGLSAFASVSAGERLVNLVRDTVVPEPDPAEPEMPLLVRRPAFGVLSSAAGGARLGGEWRVGGSALGVALVALERATATPFGERVDRSIPALPVPTTRGLEAFASVPVPWTAGSVRLDGWYARWADAGARPYLPAEQGRVALEFHDAFYDGQLEPTLRLEGVYRGPALAPDLGSGAFGAVTQPYFLADLYLQIRILDIRAFLFFENLLGNTTAADVPELLLPGPRILYGVRWIFRD